MCTLYSLSEEYHNILTDLLNYEDNIQNEEILKKLNDINEAFNAKVNNIAILLSELNSNVNKINTEIERLSKRKTNINNHIKSLKNYLKNNMLFTGKNKINTPLYSVSIRNSIETLVDDKFNQWAIDNNRQDLINIKTTYTPNKTNIKLELQSGKLTCPYVQLVQNQNISIK